MRIEIDSSYGQPTGRRRARQHCKRLLQEADLAEASELELAFTDPLTSLSYIDEFIGFLLDELDRSENLELVVSTEISQVAERIREVVRLRDYPFSTRLPTPDSVSSTEVVSEQIDDPDELEVLPLR